jgi:hypothetical protein
MGCYYTCFTTGETEAQRKLNNFPKAIKLLKGGTEI